MTSVTFPRETLQQTKHALSRYSPNSKHF
jgi:hypothetical protein